MENFDEKSNSSGVLEIVISYIPFIVSFITAVSLYSLLRYLALNNVRILRKFLYVPARKSLTNAVQLGGLPYSLAVYAGLFLTGYYQDTYLHQISLYWLVASSKIVLYGYLDDKFELRPIVKLGFQFFSVFLFSLFTSMNLSSSYQVIFFVIVFIWSFGSLNGSNLLDGLDTLTIKLSGANFLFIGALFYFTGTPQAIQLCSIFIAGLAAFYLFNKEPSTIHMGEIGGSFLGSSYVFLSVVLYGTLGDTYSELDKIGLSLLPLNLPMVESGMSFLRRIYNKKSPFSGDKLHIHHILKIHHGFSASSSASLMAAGYIGTLLLAIPVLLVSPFIGYISHIVLMISAFLLVGAKYWKGDDTLSINPKELFDTLRKKDVMIIDSASIDEFKITIISEDIDVEVLEDSNIKDDDKKAS